jgi:hypothetical protein
MRKSPLVAKQKSPPLARRVEPEREPWTVTVAVSASHYTAQGAPLKSARERMAIIAAYQYTGSYRGAAAICGTTPKTVKRVVERAQAGGVRPPPKDRVRNFEVVADLVAARVKKSSGRITAKRLLPAARAAGYEGSARNFRRLVAQAKGLAGRASSGSPPGDLVPG